jgi:hypothetical protein
MRNFKRVRVLAAKSVLDGIQNAMTDGILSNLRESLKSQSNLSNHVRRTKFLKFQKKARRYELIVSTGSEKLTARYSLNENKSVFVRRFYRYP